MGKKLVLYEASFKIINDTGLDGGGGFSSICDVLNKNVNLGSLPFISFHLIGEPIGQFFLHSFQCENIMV